MDQGRIEDIRVPVEVVLGRAQCRADDLVSLHVDSILELDHPAGVPVDIMAAGTRVGRGEVVMIGESFGVRVTELEPGEADR